MKTDVTITVTNEVENFEHFSPLAQSHIVEALMGGRMTMDVQGMLLAEDFEPIELAYNELADEFGTKSRKGNPTAKLYARVRDFNKSDKSRKGYTFKKIEGEYRVVIHKPAKPKSSGAKVLTAYVSKIADLTSALDESQKVELLDTLREAMGIEGTVKVSKPRKAQVKSIAA